MEMSLREWLIVLGVVIILGVILDGYRRIRRAKKDSLEISMGMGGSIDNTPLDEDYSPELPGGGARVVRASSNPEFERPKIYSGAKVDVVEEFNDSEPSVDHQQINHNVQDAYDHSEEVVSEDSPALTHYEEQANYDEYAQYNESAEKIEEEWQSEPDWDDSLVNKSFTATDDFNENAPYKDESDALNEKLSEQSDLVNSKESVETVPEVSNVVPPEHESKGRFGSLLNRTLKGWNKGSTNASSTPSVEELGPSEVVVVNVMSKTPEGFKGTELKTLFEACGMIHGDMSIFHRHEEVDQTSPIQFSVANSVEPGYFDKTNMESLRTPGVSFFLSLPGPNNNIQAFDYMIETAQCLVRNLNGELKDERRSVMTAQTIEHYRQKVRDFERKLLSAKV